MRRQSEGSRKSEDRSQKSASARPLIGPRNRAVMGMRLQRIQETADFCRDELARRQQRMHVERLADVVREKPPQQPGFYGRAGETRGDPQHAMPRKRGL